MNIYKLTQDTVKGYDTYDSCVVYAGDINEARTIHPNGTDTLGTEPNEHGDYHTWPMTVDGVEAELIGVSIVKIIDEIEVDALPGVICSSFNAG